MEEKHDLIQFEKFKSVVKERFAENRYLIRFFISEWKLFEHPVITCCISDKKFPLVVSQDMLVYAQDVAFHIGCYVCCRKKRFSCDLILRQSVL